MRRVTKTYLVKDSLREIQSAIEDALVHADLVLISGGTTSTTQPKRLKQLKGVACLRMDWR